MVVAREIIPGDTVVCEIDSRAYVLRLSRALAPDTGAVQVLARHTAGTSATRTPTTAVTLLTCSHLSPPFGRELYEWIEYRGRLRGLRELHKPRRPSPTSCRTSGCSRAAPWPTGGRPGSTGASRRGSAGFRRDAGSCRCWPWGHLFHNRSSAENTDEFDLTCINIIITYNYKN